MSASSASKSPDGTGNIADKFTTTNFFAMINDSRALAQFKQFLKGEQCDETICFWLDVERYKQILNDTERKEAARHIFKTYIDPSGELCVNLSGADRDKIVAQLDAAPTNLFDVAQSEIFSLMYSDTFPRFLKSACYQILFRSRSMKSLVVDTVKEAKEKPNPAPSVQVPDAVYDKFDNLLNFNDETDWKIIKNKNGVRVWAHEKLGEENTTLVRGHVTMKLPPSKLYQYLSDIGSRSEWDPLYRSHKLVEAVSPSIVVINVQFNSIAVATTPRDFCIMVFRREKSGRRYIMTCSMLHEGCPPTKEYTRASLGVSGWLITPNPQDPEGSSDFGYLLQLDTAGMIPKPISDNFTNTRPGKTLKNMRNWAETKFSSEK